MIRILILVILIAFSKICVGQINVRLFYGETTEAIVVRISGGEFQLWSDNQSVGSLKEDDMLYLTRSQDGVVVSVTGKRGFISDSLELVSNQEPGSLAIRKIGDNGKYIEYEGNLGISSGMGTLIIINNLDIEDYIAAVVQAEGGYNAHPEYFKTQAVITRTYAWLHMSKHIDEGYDLCDDVHCQVYHGRAVVETIREAVRSTRGEVITDSDSLLVLTPFHSNCGGETAASDQVWLTGKPYLIPVIDPYCSFSRNATWEKYISSDTFIGYMMDNGYEGLPESLLVPFKQSTRLGDFISGDFTFPLTRIRGDFGLRSSLFSFTAEGDSLLLKGRGYGHGVGLCQEGSMVMATRGYTYSQIIDFYYHKVKLMDIGVVKRPEIERDTF